MEINVSNTQRQKKLPKFWERKENLYSDETIKRTKDGFRGNNKVRDIFSP